MAKIMFLGMCMGTVTKTSQKTGKPYSVTTFTDLSGNDAPSFQVFGDLGLSRDLTPREYVLEGSIVNVNNVSVLPGAAPAKK